MSGQPYQVNLDTGTGGQGDDHVFNVSKTNDNDKNSIKDPIETEVQDLEADGTESGVVDEKAKLTEDAEKKEITAVEAFQWNVDGDQSPCKLSNGSLDHWLTLG